MRSFKNDYKKGNKAIDLFTKRILKDQTWKFSDKDHKEDYDIKTETGTTFEVKGSYQDDGNLCIEEWYDMGERKPGWIKTSKADYIVFVSCVSKTIIIYPRAKFRDWYRYNYRYIQRQYGLQINEPTKGLYGDEWYSAFRRIPMAEISVMPLIIKL